MTASKDQKRSMLLVEGHKEGIRITVFDDWEDLANSNYIEHVLSDWEAMDKVRETLLILMGRLPGINELTPTPAPKEP